MKTRLLAGITAAVLLLLIAIVFICLGPSAAGANPSPSPTATATPAPAELVHWARDWRKAAVRSRVRLCRVRECLGDSAPVRVSAAPRRSADAQTWRQAGRAWKHQARNWADKVEAGIGKMKNPGGSGCERWRPLIRYIWPAHLVNKVLRVMRRESHGNPRILCGGEVLPKGAGDGEPDKRAGGLMQNKPAPRHWADPFFNLWCAYYHKYLPALRAWGNGWLPWAASGAV